MAYLCIPFRQGLVYGITCMCVMVFVLRLQPFALHRVQSRRLEGLEAKVQRMLDVDSDVVRHVEQRTLPATLPANPLNVRHVPGQRASNAACLRRKRCTYRIRTSCNKCKRTHLSPLHPSPPPARESCRERTGRARMPRDICGVRTNVLTYIGRGRAGVSRWARSLTPAMGAVDEEVRRRHHVMQSRAVGRAAERDVLWGGLGWAVASAVASAGGALGGGHGRLEASQRYVLAAGSATASV